ncbi:hypothetical protein CsSME_00025206 [Camellia sinensis var. sinensis]
MEIIDTQSLSNLDLNSKPPFSYNSIKICSHAASQQLSSAIVLSRGFDSPAVKCQIIPNRVPPPCGCRRFIGATAPGVC